VNLRAFAGRIADKTKVPAASIETVLRAAIATLSDELAAAGRFEWRGLGTFAVRSYPGRKIHNPATGETIQLPARRSVAFKPSTRLRSKLKPASRAARHR
jgi:DNA-binding protein HU-beta